MLYAGNDLRNTRRLLGQKIRKRREEMGFRTQSDLASKMGVDRTRISRWETGESLPDSQSREDLKVLLEVDDGFFDLVEDELSIASVSYINQVSSFLARLAEISPERRRLIFALAYSDPSYLEGDHALLQLFESLSQGPHKRF